jgi:hypothetical protein
MHREVCVLPPPQRARRRRRAAHSWKPPHRRHVTLGSRGLGHLNAQPPHRRPCARYWGSQASQLGDGKFRWNGPKKHNANFPTFCLKFRGIFRKMPPKTAQNRSQPAQTVPHRPNSRGNAQNSRNFPELPKMPRSHSGIFRPSLRTVEHLKMDSRSLLQTPFSTDRTGRNDASVH